MNEEAGNVKTIETGLVKPRPVFLSMLCLFAFVYFALLTILFFTCIFYSGTITRVKNLYISDDVYTGKQFLFFFSAGFLLHGFAFAGSILIWYRRKIGYYFLALSCLIIATCQFFQPHIAIGTTGVYIVMIILFGLFFNRLH